MKVSVKNVTQILLLACASLICGGCGGTGGSSGASSNGGNSSSASRNASLSYHLKGVCGLLVTGVQASSTPQQVQIQVGNSTRTISNVVVGASADSGALVTILSEGSNILNTSISDVSQGATIGGTSIHVPISSSGALQASVLGSVLGTTNTPTSAVITTSAAAWQGVSLPNGINVLLQGSDAGDLDVTVNATVALNSTQPKSGNASVSVTAPTISQTAVRFVGSGSTPYLALDGTQINPGTTTYTTSWSADGAASSYLQANIGAAF